MICLFFGCWNDAGHYLFAPGGQTAFRVFGSVMDDRAQYYGKERRHLDGTLAPRRFQRTGGLTWVGEHPKDDYYRIQSKTDEYPQGQFLRHQLDNGFSAISWWDRCHGDTRGGCNSTVLLEGTHSSADLLVALRANFPHVLENLERGGPDIERLRQGYSDLWQPPENQGRVELVEVTIQKPEATESK